MKILRTIGLIILITTLGLLLFPWFLRGLGYYVDNSGGEIAKIAAEKRNPDLCDKIIVYSHILGPTSQSRRNECIYTYAEITKDPSACELLMPSSYGLSCVGGAISPKKMCNINEDTVSWWENEEKEIVGRVSFESCKQDDPAGTHRRNTCCLIARVTRVKDQNDCSSLKNDPAPHDECLARLAFKNRDALTCEQIQDANLRSACNVQTRGLKQDPSICEGCRQPVDHLSELK